MNPVRAEDDPLAALLVPFLVERTAALGEQAEHTSDPERFLAEVPDWGWLLGVVASSLGFDLAGARRERAGLALLARALDLALAAEGRGLGRPLGPWPALATRAENGWSAAWAVGRALLWAARGPGAPAGQRADLAIRWKRRGQRVVLHARSGDPEHAAELGRALELGAPAALLVLGGESFELSLPATWFAESGPC